MIGESAWRTGCDAKREAGLEVATLGTLHLEDDFVSRLQRPLDVDHVRANVGSFDYAIAVGKLDVVSIGKWQEAKSLVLRDVRVSEERLVTVVDCVVRKVQHRLHG